MTSTFLSRNSAAHHIILRPNEIYVSGAGSLTQVFTCGLSVFTETSIITLDYHKIEGIETMDHECSANASAAASVQIAMRAFKEATTGKVKC